MIINWFYNYYYFQEGSPQKKLNIDNNKMIVTNNCDKFDRIENILDTRILKWTVNNNYNLYKDKVNVKEPKSLKAFFEEQQKYIMDNAKYVDEAIKYTRIHKIINYNHKFEYNNNELLKLKELIHNQNRMKTKVPDLELEDLNEINNLENGIVYDFLNPVGKIMGKGFNIIRMDRKKNINLFKSEKDTEPYAIVDFKSFEPNMINYYIPNYIHEGFYEIHAKELEMNREEFKIKFLGWINGAGNKSLGDLQQKFPGMFPEIEQLRTQLNSNTFINWFGRKVQVNESYKKLGYLIQSTAGEFIKQLHVKLYEAKDTLRFSIVWSLFDEFLIKGDIQQFINLVREWYPELKFKRTDV